MQFRSLFAVTSMVRTVAAGPRQPVTMAEPFLSGGAADAMAKVLTQGLGERLGQAVAIAGRADGGDK